MDISLFFVIEQSLFTDNRMLRYIIVFLSLIVISGIETTRPGGLTFVIVVIELYVLERYKRNSSGIIFVLPLLALFLINWHSAFFPVLFVILGCSMLEPCKSSPDILYSLYKDRKKLSVIVLMLSAGLLNPYGIDAVLFFKNSYETADSVGITEMMAPDVLSA